MNNTSITQYNINIDNDLEIESTNFEIEVIANNEVQRSELFDEGESSSEQENSSSEEDNSDIEEDNSYFEEDNSDIEANNADIEEENSNNEEEYISNKEENLNNEKEISSDDEEVSINEEEYKSLEYNEDYDELSSLKYIRTNEVECLTREFKLDDKYWYFRVSKIFQLIGIRKRSNNNNDRNFGKRRKKARGRKINNSDIEDSINEFTNESNNDDDIGYESGRSFDVMDRQSLLNEMIDMFSNIILENYKIDCFIHKFLINYIQYSTELSYVFLEIFKYVSTPEKFNLGPIPRSVQNKLKIFKDKKNTIDIHISNERVIKYYFKLNFDVLHDFLEKYPNNNNNNNANNDVIKNSLFYINNIFNYKIITYRFIYFDSPFLKFTEPFHNKIKIRTFSPKHFENVSHFNGFPGCERSIPMNGVTHFFRCTAKNLFICLLYYEDDDSKFWFELNKWYKKHPFVYHNKKVNLCMDVLIEDIEQLLPLIATVFTMKINYHDKIYTPLYSSSENERHIYIIDDPKYEKLLYYVFYKKEEERVDENGEKKKK